MTTEALDALESIRRNPKLFAGQFPDHVMRELYAANLVERYYSGGLMEFGLGLPRVRVREDK